MHTDNKTDKPIDASRSGSIAAGRKFSRKRIDKEVLQWGDSGKVTALVEHTILPLVNGSRSEPVLMFHAYGWQYGGAERLISRIVNELSGKKYRILLVVFEPVTNTSYKLHPSISFIPICGDEEREERLLKLIDLLRPEVFIGHNSSIPELWAIYPELRARGIRSIAYTLEYFFFPHRNPALFHTAFARNKALADATVACFLTRFSANVYGGSYPNAAIMQGAASFDIESVHTGRRSGKTVLAVGRFSDPIKRLDRVLIAFKHVLSRHADAKLLIVGPCNHEARIPAGASQTIGELIRKLDLPEAQLQFVGEQKQTEPYYSQADVFILTSDSEGFPLVLTEAGSYGLPSVIVDIPGLEDMIVHGENGFIVPQEDDQAMAARICELFENPGLWQHMSRLAREFISQYSIKTVGERWDALLQLILTASSQEEINRELARRFMREPADPESFSRRMVEEYERTFARIARLPGNNAMTARAAAIAVD